MTAPGPVLPTRVAWAGFDEHRFRGRALFGELAGKASFTALALLAITGRLPTPAEVRAVDAMAGAVAVADPRIWPLKLARVASSSGSTLAGIAAETLALESELIGPWTAGAAAADLVALDAATRGTRGRARDARITDHFATKSRIVGFGVPNRPRDERVVALRAQLVRLGRARLRYWSLAERMWELLREQRGIEPNIGSALSAALLDVGIRAEHVPVASVLLGLPPVIANAVEGAEQAPEVLRSLPAEYIDYTGPRPRTSPRAEVARLASRAPRKKPR